MDTTTTSAAPPTMSVREEILWTLFGVALLVAFLVLLAEDQALT